MGREVLHLQLGYSALALHGWLAVCLYSMGYAPTVGALLNLSGAYGSCQSAWTLFGTASSLLYGCFAIEQAARPRSAETVTLQNDKTSTCDQRVTVMFARLTPASC